MADSNDLLAERVAAFHDEALGWQDDEGAPPARFADGVWHWIERNHVCNMLLWRAEERARRTQAPDAEVAGCKRSIDRHNHARHEAVELIDATLVSLLGDAAAVPDARLASETPGAMIDRLSTLSLQARRARCAVADPAALRLDPTLRRLAAQRRDLCDCLDRLLRELADGQACLHLYGPPPVGARPRETGGAAASFR
jgi:hypothetical protein